MQAVSIARSAFPAVNVDTQEKMRLILHILSLLSVNTFQVKDPSVDSRLGSGLYYPSNFINHSCVCNSIWVNRGRQQFIVATKYITQGEPINVSYTNSSYEDAFSRNKQLVSLLL